ncbi:MAG: vitamin K epoxide reductase family protein [Anaerolineales bacterium]|jgi:uncharacterized membrane protein
MKRSITLLTFLLLVFAVVPVHAQTPVVRAVMFYSPFCGHCHKVISEDIPPLSATYNQEVIWSNVSEPEGEETSEIPPLVALEGDALQILFVNTATPLGNEIFVSAIEAYEIPDPVGVPTLIVGDQYMIGSADIPAQFPNIVAEGLADGGIDWPVIPGLEESLAQLTPFEEQPDTATETGGGSPDANRPAEEDSVASEENAQTDGQPANDNPGPIQLEVNELSIRERVLLDPLGNTLSILVLIGMALSVVGVAARWGSNQLPRGRSDLSWPTLILIFIGIAVAAYLSFVETSGTEAVCGPVGDCNTVQQSEYATLFGLIPIGTLGLFGYAVLLISWFASGMQNTQYANLAKVMFFLLASAGTLFSIYLTFLEPFVIGATCMWCLSSAVIMTTLLILSTDTARLAFAELRK